VQVNAPTKPGSPPKGCVLGYNQSKSRADRGAIFGETGCVEYSILAATDGKRLTVCSIAMDFSCSAAPDSSYRHRVGMTRTLGAVSPLDGRKSMR
jgi:hypothetical protein